MAKRSAPLPHAEELRRALSYRAKATALREQLDDALATGQLKREEHLRESRGVSEHVRRAELAVEQARAALRKEAESIAGQLQRQLAQPRVTDKTDIAPLQQALREANALMAAETPAAAGGAIDLPLDTFAREYGAPATGLRRYIATNRVERIAIVAITALACCGLLGVVLWKYGPQPLFSAQSFSTASPGLRCTNPTTYPVRLYVPWTEDTRANAGTGAYGLELWARTAERPAPRPLTPTTEPYVLQGGAKIEEGAIDVLPGFYAELAIAPERAALPADIDALQLRVTDRHGRTAWTMPLPVPQPPSLEQAVSVELN